MAKVKKKKQTKQRAVYLDSLEAFAKLDALEARVTALETARHLHTDTGKPLYDEDIQALADEAEAGYDVENLKPRFFTVRQISLDTGIPPRAIRNWLRNEADFTPARGGPGGAYRLTKKQANKVRKWGGKNGNN